MLDLNKFSHSNATLDIVHRENLNCVLKTFKSDLDRTKRNVEKQRLFRPIYTGTAQLCAAEVLDFEYSEDCAKLLMPYVEGMTGSMFPIYATRNIAQTLSASLSTLLYSELNNSHDEIVVTDLFLDKLESVSDATSDPQLKQLIDSCLEYVDTLPSEMVFPLGPCHGDLTLSNVIVDPVSGITLIDFLDTYLETPLQDVAKLKQDFVYHWSFRKCPSVLGVKADILCRSHIPQAIIQIERMYTSQIRLLTLITLARIAPYVQDGVTHQWLTISLNKCLSMLQT